MLRCLAIAFLLAACTKGAARDAGSVPPAVGLPPSACERATRLVPFHEVVRTCQGTGVGLAVAGDTCAYRLFTHPDALVRVTFAPRDATSYEAARARLGGPIGRPAPTLGPRGLFFLDRTRGAVAALFETPDAVVTIETRRPHCEPGPLQRVARLFYERALSRR